MAAGAVMAAGTAIKAGAANQAGNAAADAANFNASVNEQNANFALQQSADEERQQRAYASQEIGNTRANYGASGVSSATGSALDVLSESARNAELDSLKIRNAGQMKAWGYRAGAALDMSQAANAHLAGNFGVASALFGGASSAFSSKGGMG